MAPHRVAGQGAGPLGPPSSTGKDEGLPARVGVGDTRLVVARKRFVLMLAVWLAVYLGFLVALVLAGMRHGLAVVISIVAAGAVIRLPWLRRRSGSR